MLCYGLHVTSPVDGHRAGEDITADMPVEQLDQRLQIGYLIGGVVEDDIKATGVRRQRIYERRRIASIDVNPVNAVGEIDYVAVCDGDIKALTGKLANETQADVAITAENEDPKHSDLSSAVNHDGAKSRRRSV